MAVKNKTAASGGKTNAGKANVTDKKEDKKVTVTFKIQSAQYRINKVKDFMDALGIEYEMK